MKYVKQIGKVVGFFFISFLDHIRKINSNAKNILALLVLNKQISNTIIVFLFVVFYTYGLFVCFYLLFILFKFEIL